MQILKLSDVYSRPHKRYLYASTDVRCDSVYACREVLRTIGVDVSVAEQWFATNKRCASCVVRMTSDEHALYVCRKTYGDMPMDAIREVESWKVKSKSPYSNSWYNCEGITWDYKPEGSLRLSDHWCWESNGEVHCELADAPGYQSSWRLAIRKDGKYHTVRTFE